MVVKNAWVLVFWGMLIPVLNAQVSPKQRLITGQIQNFEGRFINKVSVSGFRIMLDSNELNADGLNKPIFTTETSNLGEYVVFMDTIEFQKAFKLNGFPRIINLKMQCRVPEYKEFKDIVEFRWTMVNGSFVYVGKNIVLRGNDEVIEAVVVKAKMVEMKGDTSEINATNFKVNPDASAEDLVKKMPGVTSSNGEIQAQGEAVKKVLVDGKPFFGDDPNAALKNLPAEIVSKVQIYDGQTDKNAFTGLNDGNTTKTMNIITKGGVKNGEFGKLYLGTGYSIEGTGDAFKYKGGLIYNKFSDNQRFTILYQGNNINEQNFSFDDILGVMGGGRNRGGGGMGGLSDFFVNSQSGITSTQALGVNYFRKLGTKAELNFGYSMNISDNDNSSYTNRYFVTGMQTGITYVENAVNKSVNASHRINGRITINIDSSNRFLIKPRVSIQDYEAHNPLTGITLDRNYASPFEISLLSNNTDLENLGINGNIEMDWLHTFRKKGRSLAVTINPGITNNNGLTNLNNQLLTSNNFGDYDSVLRNQRTDISKYALILKSEWTFNESLDSNHTISLNLDQSINQNQSDRLNYLIPLNGVDYTQLDTLLSSKYKNGYSSYAGGLSYTFNNYKWQVVSGLKAQAAFLDGDQEFPYPVALKIPFYSLLPSLNIKYKPSKTGGNLRINYSTSNNAPNIEQLQDVLINTNPLQLSTGNSQLEQDYRHSMVSRYFKMNAETGRSFFTMFNGSITQNAISTFTYVAGSESTAVKIGDSLVVISPGAQLSKPINLDGAYSLRLFFNWGSPLFKSKINFNFNGGLTYSESPSMIQFGSQAAQVNTSRNPSLNGGIGVNSNISENLDFNIYSNTTYSQVSNSLQSSLNQNYVNQLTQLRINYILFSKWVVSTDITHQLYSGLGTGFNQNYFLWNAGVGRKFGKRNQSEIKVTAFDLLNQNRAISRNVSQTYFEDIQTKVLTRYIMINYVYTLRRINGKNTGEDKQKNKAGLPQSGRGHGGQFGVPMH